MKERLTKRIFVLPMAWLLSIVLIRGQMLCAQETAQEAADRTLKLAQAAQNPVANMISVPFQNNFNFGMGEEDKMGWTLNIQPVIPMTLNNKWNLISRIVTPITYQPELTEGSKDYFGLGDINPQFYFATTSGKLIWGIGPQLTFPTASDEHLGAEKFSAGPGAVALVMKGRWVYGTLVNQQWSYAGDDDRRKVSVMLIQPFVNYNLPKGWYVGCSPMITANWAAYQDKNIWTVPLGGGAGKIFRIGRLPVNAQLGAYYNVEKPDGAADWQLRFQVQLLFPVKK